MKDEEVIKATNLLENMSERIISKDKMIDLIKTERDEAVAMIENENFKNQSSEFKRISDGNYDLLMQLDSAEKKLQVRSVRTLLFCGIFI